MGSFHPYFTKKEMKTSNILYVHMQSKLPVLTACLLMADRCPQAVQCAHAYWQKTVDKRAAWQVPRDSISSCGANTGISSQRKVNAQLCCCCHSHHEELFYAFVLAHGSINTRPKSSAKKCISHVFRWVPTSSAVRSLVAGMGTALPPAHFGIIYVLGLVTSGIQPFLVAEHEEHQGCATTVAPHTVLVAKQQQRWS